MVATPIPAVRALLMHSMHCSAAGCIVCIGCIGGAPPWMAALAGLLPPASAFPPQLRCVGAASSIAQGPPLRAARAATWRACRAGGQLGGCERRHLPAQAAQHAHPGDPLELLRWVGAGGWWRAGGGGRAGGGWCWVGAADGEVCGRALPDGRLGSGSASRQAGRPPQLMSNMSPTLTLPPCSLPAVSGLACLPAFLAAGREQMYAKSSPLGVDPRSIAQVGAGLGWASSGPGWTDGLLAGS